MVQCISTRNFLQSTCSVFYSVFAESIPKSSEVYSDKIRNFLVKVKCLHKANPKFVSGTYNQGPENWVQILN